MLNLNIIGTCILRDIFNYNEDSNIVVKKFVQSVSPYAAVSTGNIIKDKELFYKTLQELDKSNFYKRNLRLDIERGVFDFLFGEKSDYLFMDIACCRFDLYYFPQSNTYASKSNIYNAIFTSGTLEECYQIDTDTIPDNLQYNLLDRYIDTLLKEYSPENIVLFEIKATPKLLTTNKLVVLKDYDWSIKANRRIEKAYNYVKQKLHGCHIIEFPNGVVADERHIWGPGVLHYVKEYYDYAYNAIKIVFSKLPLDVEKEALSSLKTYYENLIYNKYDAQNINTLKKYNEQIEVSKRLTKYVEYFTDLLLNEEKLKKVLNYFTENEIKNCAFYGATYVGKFFIDYLKKNLPELTIDYLVEDNIKDYNGVPYIKRSAKEFPPTDVIVVSDINNRDKVVKKLTDMGVKAKITDVYKILE